MCHMAFEGGGNARQQDGSLSLQMFPTQGKQETKLAGAIVEGIKGVGRRIGDAECEKKNSPGRDGVLIGKRTERGCRRGDIQVDREEILGTFMLYYMISFVLISTVSVSSGGFSGLPFQNLFSKKFYKVKYCYLQQELSSTVLPGLWYAFSLLHHHILLSQKKGGKEKIAVPETLCLTLLRNFTSVVAGPGNFFSFLVVRSR